MDDIFANAAHIVEDEFHFGRHTAVTMEPRAIVADYDANEPRLTVHHATQTPFQFQDLYSRHYGIPEACVRVIAPDIGGSFGMKLHVYHEDMAVVGCLAVRSNMSPIASNPSSPIFTPAITAFAPAWQQMQTELSSQWMWRT